MWPPLAPLWLGQLVLRTRVSIDLLAWRVPRAPIMRPEPGRNIYPEAQAAFGLQQANRKQT